MTSDTRRGESLTWNETSRVLHVLAIIMTLFLVSFPLLSQTNQGTIQGGVFDQSGGAVAGASVTVIDVARGVSRTLVTDDAGQYVASNVTPGTYTVRAEARGFRTVEHSNVLVEVGQNIRVDMVLQPGEQTQTITVTSEVPAVDTTDSVLGGAVSNQSINALPLNGRNFQRLLQLRPGVVAPVGAGAGASSTNGRRQGDDFFRVEGIAQLGEADTSPLLNSVYHGGDSTSLLPIDAIQEFNTEQNPKAEFGFKAGSAVNVGIKSGTNSIHGTAYAFGRDAQATDAGNYFSTPGISPVTPATLEQFGATAGGRIIKDKLFWFASYEGLRETLGDVAVDTIPSDVAGAGRKLSMVDACNALNTAGKAISPLSAQLAGLNASTCVVSPASSSLENLFPYNPTTSNTFSPGLISSGPLNNGIFKADYIPGPHQHISGTYFVSDASQTQNNKPGELFSFWELGLVVKTHLYEGDWAWTPNSNWVNDLRLGYAYVNLSNGPEDVDKIASNPWPSGYGIPTGVTNPLYGGMPWIRFSSFTGYLGSGFNNSSRSPEGNIDLTESVLHLIGNHSLKFGFEYIETIWDGNAFNYSMGQINFKTHGSTTDLENFLMGVPASATILLGNQIEHLHSPWYSVYGQDDWRLTPRVTLNLGLRWEYITPITNGPGNYAGTFDPNVNPATTPAVQQYGPGAPLSNLYKPDLTDISPRFGLAWDIRGNGKTVVRVGAGLLSDAAIMGELFNVAPFGANFPDIGVNTSGTLLNFHNVVQPSLTGCGAPACGLGGLNWTTTGPIFPSNISYLINGTTYTGPTCTAPTTPGGPGPCPTGGAVPNFRQAKIAEWNLDIQRAITNNLTVDVAYVGNHGFDEETQIDANQPRLGAGWDASAVGACLASAPLYGNCNPDAAAEVGPYSSIFPYLSYITLSATGDVSNYDALQVTVNERTSHGLSFLAGYTYSHALDTLNSNNVGGDFVPTDSNNLALNYGAMDQDLRHRFTFAPTYLIPGMKSPGQMLQGWSISGLLTLQSGLPWYPNDLTNDFLGTNEINNNQTVGGTIQPWNYGGPTSAFQAGPTAIPCFGSMAGCTPYPVVGGVPQPPAACVSAAQAPYAGNAQLMQLAVASLTSLGCYVQGGGILTPPAYGTVGNAPRNLFRSPAYYNLDMSIAKDWKFKERYSAQFRVEFFNLFNRADFAVPTSTDPNSGSGGQFGCACSTPDISNPVLGSGGPRHIQFGLKLAF